MATQEIEVPDGCVVFPYFVREENQELAIGCYASRKPVEYVLDSNGDPTDEEKYTPYERAYMVIREQHNRQMTKYQKKMAASNAEIITDIVI